MGEHPIEAVGRFADVFQHQHSPTQIGDMARAKEMGGHREVAHQQRPFRDTRLPAAALQVSKRFTKQQLPQTLLAPGWLGRQAGEHRPMDAAGLAGRLPRP